MTTTDWGPESSRTVTWHDPLRSAAHGMTLPGIDYLRAMVSGDVPPPPIAQLLQFSLADAEPGRVVFTCTPDASAYNPIGAVHGGLVCTLLDSVTACAVHSTLAQGIGYTSIDNNWYRVFLGGMLLVAVLFNNFVRRRVALGRR